MKKLLLIAALAIFSLAAKAQSTTTSSSSSDSKFHKFKVDLTFGYAIPPSGGTEAAGTIKAGVAFTLEPHYRITDALAIGLRIEGAGLGYGNTNDGENSDVHVKVLSSYCPSIEYYLSGGGFRPFIGAGAGIFSQQSADVNENTTSDVVLVSGGSKFGFFPRAGFEAGHFRISAEYNVLGNDANGNKSSYAAFNIGFFFGGGRR
jgi:outer membrane protein W